MSKLSRSVASALSFAHLAGIGSMRGKKARADDDEDERKDARADDDEPDDGDEQDRDTGDSKKSRKAKKAKAGEDTGDDGDESDEKDRADDGDAEDEDDKKSSRRAQGKAAADDDDADAEDDDDEDEMHGKSAAASARRRERARCAAIFGSRYAARNPVLAANLAFGSNMTRKQVLAALRDAPAESTANHSRSAKNPALGSGGEQSPSRQAHIESRWDRAMSKVRGR